MTVSSYIERSSLYHKTDTRAKILFTLSLSITCFFISKLYALGILVSFILALSLLSVGIRETLENLKRIAFILFFLILFSPLQKREGSPLVVGWGFTFLTEEGLYVTLKASFRFIIISFAFMLLLQTEKNEMIIRALKDFGLSMNMALVFSLTLRYIPFLSNLYYEIKDSLSLRLKEGKRGYPVLPIITALSISSVAMIPKTAAALEERGYGRKCRTERSKSEINPRVFTEILLSVTLPVIFFMVTK